MRRVRPHLRGVRHHDLRRVQHSREHAGHRAHPQLREAGGDHRWRGGKEVPHGDEELCLVGNCHCVHPAGVRQSGVILVRPDGGQAHADHPLLRCAANLRPARHAHGPDAAREALGRGHRGRRGGVRQHHPGRPGALLLRAELRGGSAGVRAPQPRPHGAERDAAGPLWQVPRYLPLQLRDSGHGAEPAERARRPDADARDPHQVVRPAGRHQLHGDDPGVHWLWGCDA
mmetsp:Transcript_24517/g.58109  ORF Transcript_24517/g.58109 Transcript_24517/m.58109 type:complete len:229 (-) Transcript_24517:580-1266(-)